MSFTLTPWGFFFDWVCKACGWKFSGHIDDTIRCPKCNNRNIEVDQN